ncbi:hypothetical protein LWI28_023717 [Acer negundo]|uniref:Bromo domain-containing protein n=1 Tax=Acer negundo TaxID=4023 RepID=A0AAD5J1B8_ACENE|nr:hypothetical protein LWI28_023717 [Acer negundo]
MGKVVETKKKKKGRPSLLDLQKRTLKEQQEQLQQQQQLKKKTKSPATTNNTTKSTNSTPAPNPSSNYKPATASQLRRSTRRNPNPSPEEEEEEEDEEDEDDSEGNRREKKLKLVLKLQKSSLNSNCNESDSDENAGSGHRKRKINAIGGGSGDYEQGEKSISGTNPTNDNQGAAQLDSGPSTPLPDKTLLLFILDRIQKKDTYGVYSDPVDPEELPDYHEIIEHPMDFGTVRKKLNNGAYANLEEFESDVFLICTNAMQYNSPDTIYFRQARSILELAKKNFENLRQDSDDNEPEPEPKVVRRGRPPTKNFKRPPGRPSLERAHAEFSSDATLATGAENITRTDKSGFADSSGRVYGSRNDAHAGSWNENRYERNEEVSMSKGYSMKYGKKQFVPDENRRNTYWQSQQSASGREPSVLTTFDAERKQLMAVGLHSDHGYTRSLARFAANIGPFAWKIASKRIERCLPPGVGFGPGWVGENDVVPLRPLLQSPASLGQLSSLQAFSLPENLCSGVTPSTIESKEDKLTEKSEGEASSEKHLPSKHSALDNHFKKPVPVSAINSPSLSVASSSSEPGTENAKVVEGLNSHPRFNIQNSSKGAIKARPPFQSHQSSVIHPGMNGFNGTYGFNLPAQMGKLIEAAKSAGFSFSPSQVVDAVSRTNTNLVQPVTLNSLHLEDPKSADHSNTINPGRSMPVPESKASAATMLGHHPSSWQGMSPQSKPGPKLSPQQKPNSVPPDLNVRFQSPGSPSSSRVDTTQPDLALQL